MHPSTATERKSFLGEKRALPNKCIHYRCSRVFFPPSGVSVFQKRRNHRVNYAIPNIDDQEKMPRGCAVLPLFFSVLKSRECVRGKPVSLMCSDGRMCCWHIEKQPIPLRRIQTWFSLEDVAQRSVCGPLQFLSYIYNALGHGRWFSCLLFISFLCPSFYTPPSFKETPLHYRQTSTRLR